jgi:hypothetical protein
LLSILYMLDLTTPLKVHLRVFEIHRTTLRVVRLRPQTSARFSTNLFHHTWHILTGPHGAAILGRLLWGLAFQRHPGTVVLIDGDHLVPTPFEADPPDPILLIPEHLSHVDVDLLRALRLRLRRATDCPTTLRWHTFGMQGADFPELWHDEHRVLRSRERMTKRAGFICYTAPPTVLRSSALSVYAMRDCKDSDYHYLADNCGRSWWRTEGEVQVFRSFDENVSAAIVARNEVLGGARAISSDEQREAVHHRKHACLGRLLAGRDP